MVISVSEGTVEKLGHEILEIRIRTLKYLQAKLRRSIEINEEIDFNPGALVKQLIRWFGETPICEENCVLEFMLLLVQSKYMKEILKYIGEERLKREVGKIYELLELSPHKDLVLKILETINLHQDSSYYASNEWELNDFKDPNETCIDLSSTSSTRHESLNYTEDPFFEGEEAWTLPISADYANLKQLNDSLICSDDLESVNHGIKFLKKAINDYPAEFFLQPPYIFKSLINIYNNDSGRSLMSVFVQLTKSILGRMRCRRMSRTFSYKDEEEKLRLPKSQFPVKKFCIETFKCGIENLKVLNESTSSQDEIVTTYNLLFELVLVIENDSSSDYEPLAFLEDLGHLVKYFRQNQLANEFQRIKYVLLLNVLICFVNVFRLRNLPVDAYRNFPESFRNDEVWLNELETAMYDLTLRELHPKIYVNLKNSLALDDNSKLSGCLNSLFNFDKIIEPAVKILRDSEQLSMEELLNNGLFALDTILIHRSAGLVNQLLQAISNSIEQFGGNFRIKEKSEKLYLRLLSCPHIDTKKIVYQHSATLVKEAFGALMDGGKNIRIEANHNRNPANILGIPITQEIVSEIICFGCENQEPTICNNALTIITLLLKGKPILGKYWDVLSEILEPVLPLLQCLFGKLNSLDNILEEFFYPDADLQLLTIFQGNLRFMFCEENYVRSEALSRIIYILTMHRDSEQFAPNIRQIRDTIPTDICFLYSLRDPEKMFNSGLYEASTVFGLLELLKSSDAEPQARKTSLLQLNVICQDPDLCRLIHDQNGWYLALQALQNALLENPSKDYPESAIPAIGILTKMSLYESCLRMELSNEINVFILLMRALLIFHHDLSLRQDCVLLLFILLFGSYTCGTLRNLTIPKIISNLRVPLKCNFHWEISPHEKISEIEKIYTQNLEESCTSSSDSQIVGPRVELTAQYIRLSFASAWFGNFIHNLNSLRNSSSTIDYTRITVETENDVVVIPDPLDFSSKLKLTEADIQMIRHTSILDNCQTFITKIQNATSGNVAICEIHKIQTVLLLSSDKCLRYSVIAHALRKFILTPPINDTDRHLFYHCMKLLCQCVKLSNRNSNTLHRLFSDPQDDHSLLLSYLYNKGCTIDIFQVICEYLRDLMNVIRFKVEDVDKTIADVHVVTFEITFRLIEESFNDRNLERVSSLLGILEILASTETISQMDTLFLNGVIKLLLYFILSLKSFSQAGSNFIKSCLIIIGKVMIDLKELILKKKYVKLLSGLCSHTDFEIRALAWCILEKITESFEGASVVIKELSFLPGGFHACCLCTLFDNAEVPMIRTIAGDVLSKLLMHRTKEETPKLPPAVAPFSMDCEESVSQDPIKLVAKIFRKHQFFPQILQAIDKFYGVDFIDENHASFITTSDVIRSICSVIIRNFDLDPNLLETENNEFFVIGIFNLIKQIPTSSARSAGLEMAGEICNLTARFLENSATMTQKIVLQCPDSLGALIGLIDLDLYDESLKFSNAVGILQLLRMVCNDNIGFQIVCDSLNKMFSEKFILFIIAGISDKKNGDVFNACNEILICLLLKSQSENFDFQNFIEIIESTKVSDEQIFASELLVSHCKKMFDRICLKSNQEGGGKSMKNLNRSRRLCQTIAALLGTSHKARKRATELKLLDAIIKRLNLMQSEQGLSCTDFIRKFGDTKKTPIIEELTILFAVIANWYSADCLSNEDNILELSKIFINLWPWIDHSYELRSEFLNALMFLSEQSVPVCKKFAIAIPGCASSSVLQLVVTLAIKETSKVKSSHNDLRILRNGLRTIINCCSCIEGRLVLVKLNLLNVFDRFQVFVVKSKKSWYPVILNWLQFWEVFSRYSEGNSFRQLYLLSTLITRGEIPLFRVPALTILRNMAFSNNNRGAFLTSDDFIYIAQYILEKGQVDEQILITTALWRLAAGNFRAKHTLKASPILGSLNTLLRKLKEDDIVLSETETDLENIVQIVLNILKT